MKVLQFSNHINRSYSPNLNRSSNFAKHLNLISSTALGCQRGAFSTSFSDFHTTQNKIIFLLEPSHKRGLTALLTLLRHLFYYYGNIGKMPNMYMIKFKILLLTVHML